MKYSLFRKLTFAIITVTLLTAAPSMSFGQWILGLKAGYGQYTITGADVYGGMNYKSSIEAGVVVSKKLKVDFALESGIFFSQAGVDQKYISVNKYAYDDPITLHRISSDSTFRHSNSLSLNYIKIPIMLRKSFSIKGKNVYPYRRKISLTDIDIMAGPYVAVLVSATESLDTKVSVQNRDNEVITATEAERGLTDDYHKKMGIGKGVKITSIDSVNIPVSSIPLSVFPARAGISSGLSRIDVGITAALGLSFELSPDLKLNIGGNYSMGLLSIDKEYYSNLEYVVSPGGGVDIGGGTMVSIKKNVTTVDMKNTGFGFYIGVVKYMK